MSDRPPPPSRRGRMSRARFEGLVGEALDRLPDWVAGEIDNLRVVVEDYPTRDQDPDGTGLLGLYEGVSLLDRGVEYYAAMPDTITVFMGPHIDLGLSRDDLRDEITKTVLHEVAHHLGIDDERLHDLGYD